jgi:hypothetical protein
MIVIMANVAHQYVCVCVPNNAHNRFAIYQGASYLGTTLSLKRREGHGLLLLARNPCNSIAALGFIGHFEVRCLTAHSFSRGIWHANTKW